MNPLGAEFAEKAGPGKGVGLQHPEGEQRGQAAQGEVEDEGACLAGLFFAGQAGKAQQRRGRKQQRRRGGAEFRGQARTKSQPKRQVEFPVFGHGPVCGLGGQHDGNVQGQRGEHVGEVVDREVVRLLNLMDCERAERGGQQSHPAVVKPQADEIHQKDQQQVGQGREHPPHQMNLVVAGHVQRLGHVAGEEEGKRAVHVKLEPVGSRVEG